MKNMKRLLFIGTLFILLSGCGNKNLDANFKKMEVSDKGINGYTLDLRIYGSYKNQSINEIVRIENYKNEQYNIKLSKGINVETNAIEEEEYHIKDNKVYIIADDKETEYSKDINYKNPSVYLEGLNNIVKRSKKSTEKIGENEYTVYDVTFKKDVVNKILKDTILNDLKVDKNVEGKIYLDKEEYVYRIIYNVGDITINANYFGVDKAREIR